MRNLTITLVWSSIGLAVVFTCLQLQGDESRAVFSNEHEQAVRQSIYNNDAEIETRKTDLQTYLRVPKQLTQLHKDYPHEVINLLMKIIDGGNPKDSQFAAGCALSLLKGPEVGIVFVTAYKVDDWDSTNFYQTETTRAHCLAAVKAAMIAKDKEREEAEKK